MPGTGRSELVSVAADASACPGPSRRGGTDLSSHEFVGRPPLSPRLRRRPSVSFGSMSPPLFVYLASGSPRRRELLTQIGVPFKVLPSSVDETPLPEEAPFPYVSRLAAAKRLGLASRRDGPSRSSPIRRWCSMARSGKLKGPGRGAGHVRSFRGAHQYRRWWLRSSVD